MRFEITCLLRAVSVAMLTICSAHVATAISTLPCPFVGAQPPSTSLLLQGGDHECESWQGIAQQGADISLSNLRYTVFTSMDLTNANLREADISGSQWIIVVADGVDFSNAILDGVGVFEPRFENANFSGASLVGLTVSQPYAHSFRGANFTNADLSNLMAGGESADFAFATFTGANLTNANFAYAVMTGANLAGTNLTNTTISGKLRSADLSHTNAAGISIASSWRPSLDANLDDTNFSHANLAGAEFWVGDVSGARVLRTNFSDADLSNALICCHWDSASFDRAIFVRTNLLGKYAFVTFSGALFFDSNLSSARFAGSDLSDAIFLGNNDLDGTTYDALTTFPSGSNFLGPDWGLPGGASPTDLGMIADFSEVDLSAANLSGLDLRKALMIRTVLNSADLSSSRLDLADLRYASLLGANLSSANLAGALLNSSTYDESTLFPSGSAFDSPPWGLDGGISPWGAGMIPVPEPSVGVLFGIGVLGVAGCECFRGLLSRKRAAQFRYFFGRSTAQ